MSEALEESESSQALDDIRNKIDSIDNNVHDLLMERASLVSSVARAKRGNGMQIVQPAREARLMRRLLNRHEGLLPRRTIIRIWRELISSVSMLQTGLSVVVAADEEGFARWDMAKNYFGSSLPMHSFGGLQNTISEVIKDRADFAVMPWPEMDEENPWWAHLLNNQDGDPLSIICALPYDETEGLQAFEVRNKAVVVSKVSFMESDLDNSFIGLELDAGVSRTSISSNVRAVGLNLINMYSAPVSHNNAAKVCLLLVDGFVARGDAKLVELAKRFGNSCHYYDAIGGYPVIPGSKD
jgi:chorismate mutase-like protein